MKTTILFILIIATTGMFAYTQTDQGKTTKKEVKKTAEPAKSDSSMSFFKAKSTPATFQSIWLNEKNFPMMQQATPCPFYFRPGC